MRKRLHQSRGVSRGSLTGTYLGDQKRSLKRRESLLFRLSQPHRPPSRT